jgi:hypothetical protein
MLDLWHYILGFLNPPDLCKVTQLSHLWRSLASQDVIWKHLTIDRWAIELEQEDPTQKQPDVSNIAIWKNLYKEKYLQYNKYKKLLDQVNENLFERIRTSYSMEVGEYIWEKLDTVNSIKSKLVHDASNPRSDSPVEIWKGVPCNEFYAHQNYTHFTVYLTKILYGVPYVDVIKIIERVEERHLWDQQLLQAWTLKRLDRRTDIVYMLFESMELLLLRQRHERILSDGRRVSVLGQITPSEDELEEDVKKAVHDNIRSYFDEDDIVDGMTQIKEQRGSGWCVEEIDPAKNTIRLSYQVRIPTEKAWETNLLFMAQASGRAACLPRLEEYYHTKYSKRTLNQSKDNTSK